MQAKPGWMLPLPNEQRHLAFEGEVTRGALREESTREFDGGERAPSLLEAVEEALLVGAADAPVFDEIEDLEWPIHKQYDVIGGVAREIRIRACGDERRRQARGYPRDVAERIDLHNQRDYRQPGTLTAREWSALLDAWGHRCAYCKCSVGTAIIEHVRPICLGGRTTIENIVPACFECNKSKGAKDPSVWLGAEWPAFVKSAAAALARAQRALPRRSGNAKAT